MDRNMTTVELIVHLLACYRLTRLVVADRITLRWRGSLIRFAYQHREGRDGIPREAADWDELAQADDGSPMLAYLVTCWWCAGLWIAAGWTACWWWAPDAWWPLSVGAAAAAGVGLLASQA